MYVARLDRPWLATPFLFQGFEVTEVTELKQLREYCRYVYVDVERSSLSKDDIERRVQRVNDAASLDIVKKAGQPVRQPTVGQRLAWLICRILPLGWLRSRLGEGRQYRSLVSTREEAPQALKAHETATTILGSVLETVRDGGTVDVEQVRGAVSPMIDSVLRNPDTMSWLVTLKKRDEYTYKHSIASSVWAVVLGRHLGFDRESLEILAVGGMLLDIGKTRIPDSVLSKQGQLTDFECKMIRDHVALGVELVQDTSGIGQEVLDMISSHHERHDGSGYPAGSSGAEIPVFGRIAGIVDCYDAMITQRPYASAKSTYDAIRELNTQSGKQFQSELVEQFVQALGMFPSGSLIELNTGEVGIVIEQNRVRRLRPKIMLLLDKDKQPLAKHKTIDLRKLPSDAREQKGRWIAQGCEPGSFGIDPQDYFL